MFKSWWVTVFDMVWFLFVLAGMELTESKEKLARVTESSSSDSEDEAANRRKSLNENGDKPTEEVSTIGKIEFNKIQDGEDICVIFENYFHLMKCRFL
jgi:hypothetical protein